MLKNTTAFYKFLLLILTAFCSNMATGQVKHTVIWGVNGHPLTQPAYFQLKPDAKNDMAGQIAFLKSTGFKYYRFDVPTNDGLISSRDKFLQLASIAAKQGIKLLPMVYLAGFDAKLSAADAYAKGLQVGTNFTRENGKYFDYVETGNEEESAMFLNNTPSPGNLAAQFDRLKMRVLASYLKGMITGIKKVKPGAKVIINTGWVHYGYLDVLKEEGVNFDIVGYHWYSDMGKLSSINGYSTNIINLLYNRYKKPIWFTEIGRRNGSKNGNEQDQAAWAATYIAEIKANPHVQAAFFYELYDEPVFAPGELADHGLIKWNSSYTVPTYKPIVNVIKKQISLK